jgi:hypothetical protein
LILFVGGCSVSPLYNCDTTRSKTGDIYVDVIAEREGQKLRSHLVDAFRDIKFAKKKYRLIVKLSGIERQFAISSDGNAKRVLFVYNANVMLQNSDRTILMNRNISASTVYNISHAHGEVTLSLYGRHNDALLKELTIRIVENIKMVLSNEN